MQTSFMDLVGATDAMAAGATLEAMQRQELGRELTGLTPAIDTSEAAPQSQHASEAIATAVSCPICIGADLSHQASEQAITGTSLTDTCLVDTAELPGSYHPPYCINETASAASQGPGTPISICNIGEPAEASEAVPSNYPVCIRGEAHAARAPYSYVPPHCVCDEAHAASDAMPSGAYPACISVDV